MNNLQYLFYIKSVKIIQKRNFHIDTQQKKGFLVLFQSSECTRRKKLNFYAKTETYLFLLFKPQTKLLPLLELIHWLFFFNFRRIHKIALPFRVDSFTHKSRKKWKQINILPIKNGQKWSTSLWKRWWS